MNHRCPGSSTWVPRRSHRPSISTSIRLVATGVAAAMLLMASSLARVQTRAEPALQPPAPAKPEATRAGAQARTVVVPFEMLPTNHMLVQARINGKGPYHLIFDLGAPITLVSNRASEAAGVVKDDAPRAFLFAMRGEAEI